MNKETQAIGADLEKLAMDARILLDATANSAEAKVVEARQRLQAALENGKEIAACARAKAIAGIKATDAAVREHPYIAVSIAALAGTVLGLLLAKKCSSIKH
jgi:ElaB/YqjD/DUF883 family membrane-anchored ribosome-binding protein